MELHYDRECRENVFFQEIFSAASPVEGSTFRLERSYPDADSFSLYTSGSGKGKTKADGTEVNDLSSNGIYTTGSNGGFIMNLPEGYYRLTETTVRDGYEPMENPVSFHVSISDIPDTEANAQASPYSVDSLINATWKMNDYATWDADKVIGTIKSVNHNYSAIAQVSLDGGSTWKEFEWLINVNFSTFYA
jgi:hypothetical protein